MTVAAGVLLAAGRAAPVAFLSPALGERARLVRLVMAGVLAFALWPAVVAMPLALPLGVAVAHELMVGVALGLVAAVPFAAAQAAGALVDRARGDGRRSGRSFQSAYSLLALALFASLSGPRLVVSGLAQSYVAFPLGGTPSAAGGIEVALTAGGHLVVAAVGLAAPVLAALLLADLVAGLAVRAQPALAQAIGLPSVRNLLAAGVAAAGIAVLARALLSDGEALPRAMLDAARQLKGVL